MTTQYLTTLDLEPYFVDKDTGAPLAGGYVEFWEDADRTVPKLVFTKQNIGADPVTGQPIYQFIPLPNPVQLSGVGTFQDANGNNIAVYYFPYDANGNVQLYYIAVFNYLGVPQFTREGWGFNSSNGGNGNGGVTPVNMILNSQFAVVNFDTTIGLTYTSAGAETPAIPIAPGWVLNVAFAGVGTVTVNRVSIAGNANLDTNPPYVLSIAAGANISSMTLVQRLEHNPGIWSAITAGLDGWVASFMLLGPGTNATMSYAPSIGAPTQLVQGNNAGAEYVGYRNTTELPESANTATPDTGYADISIALPTSGTALISSIQIMGMETEVAGIPYQQQPVNLQVAGLFDIYFDQLKFKPIPSHLVGWNFAINPAQLGINFAAFTTGANTSTYTWDSTIVFQSVDGGFTTSNGTSGALRLTTTADCQLALIQYIPGAPTYEANNILFDRICSMVQCATDSAPGYNATVSIWATTDASLPDISTNKSLVATLDANGKPATFNGNWVEIPRSNLGDARFKVATPGTTTPGLSFNYYPFTGWAATTNIPNTATFIAIVVGTAVIPSGKNWSIQSISMQSGQIPTIPGAETAAQVLAKCQTYYEKSFNVDTVPTTAAGSNTGEFICSQTKAAGGTGQVVGYISYKVSKRRPAVITTYNPVANNAQVRNESGAGSDCSATTVVNNNNNGYFLSCTTAGGSNVGDTLGIHWTADSRLGF